MRLMEREFAVVLLDVSMPGMDGFETAATIHDHPRFERTPIIFVTGGARQRVRSPARLQARRGRLRVRARRAGDPAQQGRGVRGAAAPPPQPAAAQRAARRGQRAARAVQLGAARRAHSHLEMFNRNLAAANEELAARTSSCNRRSPSVCAPKRAQARRSPEGRFPRDPGARAPQPARADTQRRGHDEGGRVHGPRVRRGARRRRPPGHAPDAPGRRSARRLAHQPWLDHADAASR